MKTLNGLKKGIYLFGKGQAEGNKDMQELLGGKGANIAEMNNIGIPVPPGFTITTEACLAYNQLGKNKLIENLNKELKNGVEHMQNIMSTEFGSINNPCLVSVRSGARKSMPGMMDTILNIGLNDQSVLGLSEKTGSEKFAWDSYRRMIQMYASVVMKINTYTEDEIDVFENIIDQLKSELELSSDRDLTAKDLKELVSRYKKVIKDITGREFPSDPWEQLWNSIIAVFDSWFTPRAVLYRKLNNIPNDWGTAVNVQAMVFGNMGNKSCSGVAFTRNAATGVKEFNGEYMINAQGEDVVAGIRTPLQITKKASLKWAELMGISEEERSSEYSSLEEYMPQMYDLLNEIQLKLENHYAEMQDLEFTIQEEKLWLLQTRRGKRTGAAMVKIGMDMLNEGLIDEKTVLKRMIPGKLEELLHPVFSSESIKGKKTITKGLPASPGAASGEIAFFTDRAEKLHNEGKKVILVRTETSADDLKGMSIADGILTARGGMTSHAAVVARGMGKCCITGVGSLQIDYKSNSMKIGELSFKEGDQLSLDGSQGFVYNEMLKTVEPTLKGEIEGLMSIVDKYTSMSVRANADTPETAKTALDFGAKGIGLCRTEHMFFERERIKVMREMILATTEKGRKIALDKLLPMQRKDFEEVFEIMQGFPVTIRLLDPPLHEFVPYDTEHQQELAKEMNITLEKVKYKVDLLREINPMLGHRGCRLGNTFPEITKMQTRAIIEAALNLKQKGIMTLPEIMIPLVGELKEYKMQEKIIKEEIDLVFNERNDTIEYLIGTMIEIPRATLIADKIALKADFFSFGTNDLTQMTYGYSRDDSAKFLPIYLEKGILKYDPFEVLDQEGVGMLLELGVNEGRKTKPNLKVGICGEHGGEPNSIEFFHKVKMDYISCSPYRVPIARLAAAQAAVKDKI